MIRFLSLMVIFGFAASSVRASSWIGCSDCQTQWVSQSCAMCAPPTFPTVPPWGMPQLPYCPTCMANNPGLYELTPGVNNNWWMRQAPNYWNFYMPGPYNGWGMMPNYFPALPYSPPGGDGFYAAKPVVYLRGPSGSKVEIEIATPKGELLVTVPNRKNWKAEIQGAKLKTKEGNYEYFFYDAWLDHNGLQDQKGACGDRKETLAYMETALKQAEFPSEAIREFKNTWSAKLPHQQELCVFPQTEEQLKSAVELKFKPASVKLTQLEFIVVAKKFFGSPDAKKWSKFTQEPKKEFGFRSPASEAAEGNKYAIRAFDWGVGFLRADK